MSKNMSRRHLLSFALASVGSVTVFGARAQARRHDHAGRTRGWAPTSARFRQEQQEGLHTGCDPKRLDTPYTVRDRVKVFHLIAEPVKHEFAPGLRASVGAITAPHLVRPSKSSRGTGCIYVTNRLPEPTSVHWHGILLPNGMDGVSGMTQKAIQPGQTFHYAFTLRAHMYHPHFDEMTQMALGMQGS